MNDLISLGSIENAVEHLIEAEISSFLYKSIDDWQQFFKDTIDLDLKNVSVEWGEIVEIYQRRHIFVHNRGIVSKQYLAKVDKKYKDSIPIGDSLKVDMEYLKLSNDLLLFQGIIIINALWANLVKKDISKRCLGAMYISTYTMYAKRWTVGRACLTEFLKDKRLNGAEKMTVRLTYGSALKGLRA